MEPTVVHALVVFWDVSVSLDTRLEGLDTGMVKFIFMTATSPGVVSVRVVVVKPLP